MKKSFVFMGLALAVLLGVSSGHAGEMPEFPKPEKEHEWLGQLTGEWEYDAEMYMDGQSPVKISGKEKVRPVGGFWIISEQNSEMFGTPFTGILTLGFDASKKRFIGTWIDSMTGNPWNYEGTLDASGKVLALDTEGQCPGRPGKWSAFKEVIEIKDKDHRVFTSSMQGEDGKWTTIMRIDYRRKS